MSDKLKYTNEDQKLMYQMIRNILHNEMGLDRNGIEDLIREEVNKRAEHVVRSINLEKIIANQITWLYKSGFTSTHMFSQGRVAFETMVKEQVQRDISEALREKLKNLKIEF